MEGERDCFLMFVGVWVHMYTACRSQKSSSGMILKELSTLGFLDRGTGSLTGVELTKQTRLLPITPQRFTCFCIPGSGPQPF